MGLGDDWCSDGSNKPAHGYSEELRSAVCLPRPDKSLVRVDARQYAEHNRLAGGEILTLATVIWDLCDDELATPCLSFARKLLVAEQAKHFS